MKIYATNSIIIIIIIVIIFAVIFVLKAFYLLDVTKKKWIIKEKIKHKHHVERERKKSKALCKKSYPLASFVN